MSLRWMIGATAAVLFSTSATGEAASQAVMLRARDGVSISGLAYTADHPKAIVLLERDENRIIVPVKWFAGAPQRSLSLTSSYGPPEPCRSITTSPPPMPREA